MKTESYKTKLWHLPFAISAAVLFNNTPSGGASGGGTSPAPEDWRAGLPDDLKAHPSLSTLKTIPDLAKSYVNAQQLIGAKRIALPPQNASEQQLNEFYAALGRPEAPDKYTEGSVKFADGITLDKAGLGKAKETFFKLGLTDAQQKGILDFYATGLNEQHSSILKELETSKAKTEESLRAEWGNDYTANYETVKTVIGHFGNEEFVKELDTQLGNNPGLVRMLLKVGKLLQEDKTTRNKFSVPENGPAAMATRRAELTADVEFQKTLNTPGAPGHQEAVELWTSVHR